MNNNFEQEHTALGKLFKKGADIRMSLEEKEEIATSLKAYMTELDAPKASPVQSPFFSHIQILSARFMPAALILTIIIGGGASAAANRALPGDILYPVKVHVNEEARSLFSMTAESDAALQVDTAHTRLAEVEQLSTANKLSVAAGAEAKAEFNAEAAKVQQHVDELRSQGNVEAAYEVSSNFEASLKNHKSLLVALSEEEGKQKTGKEILADLAADVETHLRVFVMNREESERILVSMANDTNAEVKAEASFKDTRNKIEEVGKYVTKYGSDANTELKVEADAKLNLAKGIMAEGEAKLKTSAYAEAIAFFKNSARKAEEARILVRSRYETKTVLPTFLRLTKEDDASAAMTATLSADAAISTTSATTTESGEGSATTTLDVNLENKANLGL